MSQPMVGGKPTANTNSPSPQSSRMRHFLKLNGPSNNNNNDMQQKSNGHIESVSSPKHRNPSSPLIGRNYPHQRVSKSPSVESTKSSSPLLQSTNRCHVINLNPVNVNHSKQNSFDHSCSSPNLNSQSKPHRHSFRCTSTTSATNNTGSSSIQLRKSQHTYDNVSRFDQQQSPVESPRFIRKNFSQNVATPNSTAIDPAQSTYGQIALQSNPPRWQQHQNIDQTTMANAD
ncbi:hypothetical protein BLA29_009902, partial [Euroglyphus maynei]